VESKKRKVETVSVRKKLLYALIGLAADVSGPSAQTSQAPRTPPAATFQVSVNYVDVDVTVTDAQGHFIRGLTRDDFELFEDGKLQKVDTFSYVDIPIERQPRFLVAGRPVTSDVRSNREAAAGRVYVIVLDDLDVSAMRTTQVRKSAREFVEKYFGASDVAAVVSTSGRGDLAQDFTSDPQLLLAAIDKFAGQRMRPAEEERIDYYYNSQLIHPEDDIVQKNNVKEINAAAVYDPSDLERGQRAVGVLDSMKNLAEFLGGVRGRRKALLLFSEGLDYPMADAFTDSTSGNEIIRATQDAMTAAALANVNFYTLDPRGLIGMATDLIETTRSGPPAEAGTSDIGTWKAGTEALLSEMNISQNSLRTLAEGTGGFAGVNSNSLVDVFDRIVEANSRYYLLGYNPPAHPRDGRFHKIEVRVTRPGLKVAARKGYPSPHGRSAEERQRDDEAKRLRDSRKGGANNTSAELRDVLNTPVQHPGLPLTVQAAAFRSTPTEAAVDITVEVDGSRLQFGPPNAKSLVADGLELSLFSLTSAGKAQRGYRSELNLAVLPATYQRIQQYGVRAQQRIALAPGRYQLRVGVRESAGGQAGSVFYDLQVPDFRKDPVMVSGLLLTSVAAQQTLTAQHDAEAEKLLLAPATTRRTFPQSDVLAVLVDIYDNNTSTQPRTIDVAARLVTDSGRDLFTARDSLTNGGTDNAKVWNTYAFTRPIPLKDIPPGRYLLRIEARDRARTNEPPAASETVVTVTN
jgi:VWFA-related protein